MKIIFEINIFWCMIDYMSTKKMTQKEFEAAVKRLHLTKRSGVKPTKVFKNKKKYSRKAKHV
jgi:hypothetical protein